MTALRTLLVYDTPGWAFFSECQDLSKQLELHAPGHFAVTLARAGTVPGGLHAYDVIFSAVYYSLLEAGHPKSISQVSSYSYWIRKGWPDGWPHLRSWQWMIAKNKHILGKLTSDDHPRIKLLYQPIDSERWSPVNRGPRTGQEFTVGFAGHRQAIKGLDLIEEAARRLSNVQLKTPTWESGRIPHDEMPDFYRSLDAYICMSKPEEDAGPRPPIEAGLCGVPIITTRVGQIGEMVIDGETGLVVERSVEALCDAIKRLQMDLRLRQRLSLNTRADFVENWSLAVGRKWTEYFLEIAETAA